MSALKYFLLTGVLSLLATAGVQAQSLVLKDGSRIDAGEFTVNDGKITRMITLSNGQKGQASINFSDIDMMDWQDVKQVTDSQALLAAGKVKESIDLLTQAKEYFKPFKTVKGTPYTEVSFALVEALDQLGDFDALLKVLPEVESMKWEGDKKLKLNIIKLNMERRTSSDQDAVLARAESLLSETDDSTICARLWMTIAEIHTKKERYEAALMAWLQIPVFYGSQTALVPQAELNAARALTKMERFEDAIGFYNRIGEAYPGSGTAETAKKEMLTINGLKNKPDKIPQADKDSEKKTESK